MSVTSLHRESTDSLIRSPCTSGNEITYADTDWSLGAMPNSVRFPVRFPGPVRVLVMSSVIRDYLIRNSVVIHCRYCSVILQLFAFQESPFLKIVAMSLTTELYGGPSWQSDHNSLMYTCMHMHFAFHSSHTDHSNNFSECGFLGISTMH